MQSASRIGRAAEQWRFLFYELNRMANRRRWRYFSLLFSASFQAVAAYRLSRSLHFLLGRFGKILRVCLSPLLFLLRPWLSRCDIHYEAAIGKGLMILHPSLGVVVTARSVIGEHFTLTGGNCIGTKGASLAPGDIQIGDGVYLGVNAVVLGPIRIGNHAVVSAGSLAVRDVGEYEVVAGIPARMIMNRR
jgi:serine O-acetyltransferase